MKYLLIILLEEEMVRQVVENHRVLVVNTVGSAQLCHAIPD